MCSSRSGCQWTEWLFSELRSRLGPSFPLYNITSGIHSSPAVVNHEALRRHNVIPIWEAYDENGVTLGVGRTAAKAADEGWSGPQIAIGDKSLATDLPQTETRALAGVWLWAPDNGSPGSAASSRVRALRRADDSQPPGPGIQVGPPLDADQGRATRRAARSRWTRTRKPRWWDLPGRVRYGIDELVPRPGQGRAQPDAGADRQDGARDAAGRRAGARSGRSG